jgi:hypothetical protein
METTINVSGCKSEDKVRFAANSFKGKSHIWWKTILATWGREKATRMGWRKFRQVFLKKCVPNHEVEQLEDEYLHLKMEGTDYRKYTSRFLQITGLIPDFAGSESKRIGRFIWAAHPKVRANMRTTKPRTIQKTTELLAELTKELIRTKGNKGNDSGLKRKFDGNKFGKKGNKFSKGRKSYTSGGNKARRIDDGDKAACQHYNRVHSGECKYKPCDKCGRKGHATLIVVSHLFVTLVGSKAISGLIVQVSVVPLLLTRGKEPVPPRITLECS